jgi:hypothetical protein
MKIAYLACIGVNSEAGVRNKIHHQISAWIEQSIEVRAFILTGDDNINDNLLIQLFSGIIIRHDGTKRSFLRNLSKLISSVKDWNPDIIYHRYFHYNRMLVNLFKQYRTILEINSNDLTEYKLCMSKVKYLVHIIRRKWLFKAVKGFVTVTKEIGAHFEVFKKPICVLANGIALSDYPSIPAPKNQRPALSFLGYPGYEWHGVDKIVELAEFFKQWDFNIIGYVVKDFASSVPPNVSLLGYLTKDKYQDILAKTDVAIGTLALHRAGMNEACPLKTREYLAYGLPVIIGYIDTDFPNEKPFLLRLPNEENTIIDHGKEIKIFVENWQGKRVNREDIAHLDINYKAQKQIHFSRKILKCGTVI